MTDALTGYRVSFAELLEPTGAGDARRAGIREIEIPVIQRDYAQGRDMEEVRDIRASFLDALRGALTGGDALSLDFIWGDLTGEVLRPLDGQQRLTTLFLLHWYLAQRAHVDVAAQRWTRFSYTTRHSSRRFVEELCSVRLPDELDGTCGDWIVDQEWFHFGWEHDPTIKSMVVMLDAIEVAFRDDDADVLWGKLNDADSPPVSFYVLPIEEMGQGGSQGDHLYIKMNSRGKPLTSFENFKALFEQAVKDSSHGDAIAHKIDGAWSDVMWPHRGGDDIVDEEFMKYFTFLIEMEEWRAGLESQGSLIHRAERLMGRDRRGSAEALDFFVDALDTWVGEDTDAYFSSLFRPSGACDEADDRPRLFTPDHLEGVNLFAHACAHYGGMRNARARAFPLGLSLLLHAVLYARINQTPGLVRRLRVLRNVIEASENEVRLDRMPALIHETEEFVASADLAVLESFNQTQVDDERRKAEFLEAAPDARAALNAFEDHSVLRGSLISFELDAAAMTARANAFDQVFADSSTWPALRGALLATGDYFRRPWLHNFHFGSPTAEGRWRTLLTGSGRSKPESKALATWSTFLDEVTASTSTLGELYTRKTAERVAVSKTEGTFDWRYYLLAYPEMREGESGIFHTENEDLDFEMCALRRSQMNSKYRDPYLYAVYVRSGLEEALENPWFSGYAENGRWLRVTGSEISIRCRNHGYLIDAPGLEQVVVDSLEGLPGSISQGQGHVVWAAPQDPDTERPIDLVDRVEVGCTILRALVNIAREQGNSTGGGAST